MIHFDTSFVVDFLRETSRDDPGPATALLDSLPPEDLAVSVFVVCELLAGAAFSREAYMSARIVSSGKRLAARGELIAAERGERRAVLYKLFTPMPGRKKMSPDYVRTEERAPTLAGDYQLRLKDGTLKGVSILCGPKELGCREWKWKYHIEVEDDPRTIAGC